MLKKELDVRWMLFVKIASLTLLSLGIVACAGGGGATPAAKAPAPASTVAAPTVAAPTVIAPGAAPKAGATSPIPPTVAPKTTTPTTPTVASKATTAASPPAAPKNATPQTEVVVSGLDTPWAIDFAPDGRWFISERAGRIRIVKDGKLQPEPWMTLPVTETGESGLLGIALDPQFAQNRFVYAAYTYRANNRLENRVVRLREDPATGKGVLDKTLVDAVPSNTTHSGGRVRFGPDGKLYWTMGDAQQQPQAQEPASLLGKVHRMNGDGTIPADNPFPNSMVYSIGHRNPQGLAWQPGTGRLYTAEHGPSGGQGCCRDEINFIEPGKNYGWPIITGDETRPGLLPPVIHSGNNNTWAPGGATFVTRGPWAGSLLFTGLRGQALYRVTLDPSDPRKAQAIDTLLEGQFGRLRDVVEGPDGALYVLTSNLDGRGNAPQDGDRVLKIVVQ